MSSHRPTLVSWPWILVVAVTCVAAALWWPTDGSAPPAEAAPPPTGQTQGAPGADMARGGPASGGTSAASTVHQELARLFELGFSGGLVVDESTLGRMESVLAGLPPEPTQEDFGRLERALREQLPREEADRALGLLTSYRGYLKDVRQELMTQPVPSDPAQVEALLARNRQLQQRHFDALLGEALFAERNERDRVALSALAIENDPRLSPAEKTQRYAQLRGGLPPALSALVPERAQDDRPAASGS